MIGSALQNLTEAVRQRGFRPINAPVPFDRIIMVSRRLAGNGLP